MICGLSNRANLAVWAWNPPPAVIDRIAAPLDPHGVRLHVWIVGLVLFAACQDTGPSLSESSSAQITTSPASTYAFPTTQVNTASTPAWVTVSPQGIGSQYDTVTAVTKSASCPDFIVNAPYLPTDVYRFCVGNPDCPPGQICPIQAIEYCNGYWDTVTYQFSVTFKPVVAAATSCQINIHTSAGQTRSITFSGTGSPPPVDIDVQPPTIGFGDVRRNTASTAAQLVIRNYGGSTLNVTGMTVSGPFQLSGPTSYPLGPQGAMTHTVTCTPPSIGAHSGAITITSNDTTSSPLSVPLSCRGIDSNLDMTPSPATIPTTRVGEPVMQTITIQNSGNAAMTIQSVTLSGTDLTLVSGPTPGMALGAGGVAPAQIRFGATASGDVSGTLTITYDGGQARSATLSARALSTSMSLSPDGNVDLGAVCVGQAKDQELTVLANDQGGFQITEVATPDAPFELRGVPSLPATIAGAGANPVAFTVRATPTTDGTATSTVRVTTDIPGAAPREISVAVTGLTAGVSATPATLEFGATPVDATTIGQDVHLTNCATAPVTLANARIEGPDAGEFAIVQQPQSMTIETGASIKWLVVSQPRSPGPKEASFVVDGPEGPVSAMLVGDGLGDAPGGPGVGADVPSSYYACSTGGATGASPLVLVLALVLRRRRRA